MEPEYKTPEEMEAHVTLKLKMGLPLESIRADFCRSAEELAGFLVASERINSRLSPGGAVHVWFRFGDYVISLRCARKFVGSHHYFLRIDLPPGREDTLTGNILVVKAYGRALQEGVAKHLEPMFKKGGPNERETDSM